MLREGASGEVTWGPRSRQRAQPRRAPGPEGRGAGVGGCTPRRLGGSEQEGGDRCRLPGGAACSPPCCRDRRHFRIPEAHPVAAALGGRSGQRAAPSPATWGRRSGGRAEALPAGAQSRDVSPPHSLLSPDSQTPRQEVRHPPAAAPGRHTGAGPVQARGRGTQRAQRKPYP